MNKILALAQQRGIIRPADLLEAGLPVRYLGRLCEQGRLVRIDRGLYELPDRAVTEQVTLAVAARRVPRGVICLLSALQFHELTTQQPRKVWMAIDRAARTPSASSLSIQIVRFSGLAFTAGVQTVSVDSVPVRIYDPAKTVADCFKARNKIGLDVALEALREGLRSGKVVTRDLWRHAKICRVTNVMRPYLEAIA